MTYTELQNAIAGWLHRDGVTQIPTFIQLATARLSADLRLSYQETIYNFSATSEYSALPSDFASMRYMTLNGKRGDYKRPEVMVDMVATGWVADPAVYTIVANQLRIFPAPSVTSPTAVSMVYFAEIPDPSVTNGNWVLTSYPQLYLQACMVEARQFVKAGTWQEWEARYQDTVNQVTQQADYFDFGGPIAVSAS